jgi:hypothetical protein
MTNPALNNALIRQTEISAALAKISADLAEVSTFIQSYYKMSSLGHRTGPLVGEPSMQTSSPKAKLPTKHEVLESVKVARLAIGDRNKPLNLDVLYSEACARGFLINTSRPTYTYGARLRDRKKRVGLIFLKGHGWWLSERPYPPANYMPSTTSRAGMHVN